MQSIGALIAVIACAVILEAPKKFLLYAGIIGASGWCMYLLTVNSFGMVKATFISGLIIAFLAHIFSKLIKAPVTIFLIPGFFPLVPGVGMYRTVYYFLKGQKSLFEYNLTTTFEVAGMIAFSIFIIDSMSKIIKRKYNKVNMV